MTSHSINFVGRASVVAYEQALRSVSYENTAPEPQHTPRVIVFRVNDGLFMSNTLQGVINISLSDDNPLMLNCPSSAQFTEGATTPISITKTLTLTDLDVNQVVQRARVVITNPQQGDMLAATVPPGSPLTVVTANAANIEISGAGSTADYQVSMIVFIDSMQ